jgi:Ribbon-helix-helix protein, copG family
VRTTVTIDDHLLERAKERARERGLTLGDVVEASLLRYLALPAPSPGPPLPVFQGGGGLLPGIDPSSNASMFDAADGPVEIDGDLG